MNILYVTYGLPYPPHSGARMRDLSLIRQLSQRHTVHLFSLLESEGEAQFASALKPYCGSIELFPLPRQSVRERAGQFVRHIAARRPLATLPFMHTGLYSRIHEMAAAGRVDAVQIEHSILAPYVEALPREFRGARVLSLHNLGEVQYQRMGKLELGVRARIGFVIKSHLMSGWEARYAERFDRVIVVSDVESAQLRASNPRLNVVVIENGVDTRQLKPLPEASEEQTLLFVGSMRYTPNVDAMLWFCRDILPHVARAVPNVKFLIVGRYPSAAIEQLANRPNVIVTGHVPDILPYYQQAAVSIAPLRAGGGTRLKILEAMAYGRPVVSTSMGCEGLEVLDRENILIADEPNAFADTIIHLLTEPACRETIARNARRLVETRYDWSLIGDKLISLYDGLARHAL